MLLVGSLAGGCVGALFDQLTVTISPAYFLEGKGLDAAPEELRAAVAWLGFRAGLPLGALVTGVALLRSQRVARRDWIRWAGRVAAIVSVALVAGALLMPLVDPFDVRAASAGVWPPQVVTRYLVCWGLHIGAYVGLALGLLRARRA